MARSYFTLLYFFLFSNLMAQQYETQHYELIKTLDSAQIRYYPSVMKIRANKNKGFNALFGYISGKNETGQKIAMTTPVYMQQEEGQEVMEFVLPRSFDQENAPNALSQNVAVYQSKPGYFIALRFGGYALDWVTNRALKALDKIVEKHGIQIQGSPLILVYNSPYQVLNRKNEILYQIEYRSTEK